MIIKNEELLDITGGAISVTLLNSVCRLAKTLLDLGRAVGNAIRTAQTGLKCN